MAGGKETPRQKMIGMMYLVLTALLALQVSSAVLEKFAIINVTLEEVVNTRTKVNEGTLSAIREATKGKTNPKVLKALENAEKTRKLTNETLRSINELKKKMMAVSDADQINEQVINDHSSRIATLMIDTRASQTGPEFEQLLNNYIANLSQISGEEYRKIARAPSDMPLFKDNPDHKQKDFLTFTFENTPSIAAIASVTEFQTEILDRESEALHKLALDADAGVVKFDKIVPMVRPKSSIVAAGDTYEADMFITASAEGITPAMFRDGKKIEVVRDKDTGIMMGKVSFPASASNYDASGLAKRTFIAEIRIGDGDDKIFKTTIDYAVARPVIRVTTGNAPTLYMNCGNLVNIEVPALGTNYNPSFATRGGATLKGDKVGRVTIVPKQRKVTVTVSNKGLVLGSEVFNVKKVPPPKYVARTNNGKKVNLKDGVQGSRLTGLRVSAEADENFKQEVPADARYRIRSMEVILARGTQRVATLNARSEILDLSSWRSRFRPGDRIIIDIKQVIRRTFEKKNEKVPIQSEVINVPVR